MRGDMPFLQLVLLRTEPRQRFGRQADVGEEGGTVRDMRAPYHPFIVRLLRAEADPPPLRCSWPDQLNSGYIPSNAMQ